MTAVCALEASGYHDTFARDHLPPAEQWPQLIFDLPALGYPARLNCATALLDEHVAAGHGDRIALYGAGGVLTYAQLAARANQIARVLTEDLALATGSRVLLRGGNNLALAAAWLGVIKAGCIAVTTMPLLRERELTVIVHKAAISAALCDRALADEMERTRSTCPELRHTLYFTEAGTVDNIGTPGISASDAPDSLDRLADAKHATFVNADSAADDVALIAFTSGTTGVPKGTMHFHRDVLAICDVLSRQIIAPTAADIFIGTPPLAFTFGLGGLLLFPLRAGASAVLVEHWTPQTLLEGIARFRASICFTAPTMYRKMAPLAQQHQHAKGAGGASGPARLALDSLRITVSSGEMLPADTRQAWLDATGIEMTECLGATELLHAFIACTPGNIRPGATGRVVPGYKACVLGTDGEPLPPGEIGRLAVKGPTGCRYLDDARQPSYVQNGWNLTGDAYRMDADGYFWYQSRTDDMIVSAGYNIAGPEVEEVLLTHSAVAECGVIGAADTARGQIVKAYIVLREGHAPGAETTAALQDLVKRTIAPYKYPRAIEYVATLPRTENGKLQRFRLRQGWVG